MKLLFGYILFCLFFRKTFQCPTGSDQIPNETVCVYPIADDKSYSDALNHCAVFGGIPAKIQNVYENSFLLAMMPMALNGQPAYIGVSRNGNHTWTYSDGSPLVYQNWAQNEPKSNNCATMDPSTGKWFSADCSIAQPFFCSVDENDFQCPDDWIYHEKTDYCYYFQDFTFYDHIHWQLYNWSISESNCQRMGSHLVSIHSKEEDDFIYDLIASNVANDIYSAPHSQPCHYQDAWIGYCGNGTLGTGRWSDGSPVDYNGYGTISELNYWAMTNDDSCQTRAWDYGPDAATNSRYVCKMASKSRMDKTRRNDNQKIKSILAK